MKLRALVYTTEELGLPSGLLPVLCDAILDDMHPAQVPGIEPQATHRDEVVAMGGLRGRVRLIRQKIAAYAGAAQTVRKPCWPKTWTVGIESSGKEAARRACRKAAGKESPRWCSGYS